MIICLQNKNSLRRANAAERIFLRRYFRYIKFGNDTQQSNRIIRGDFSVIIDISKIAALSNFRIKGLFSHMSTADAYDKTYSHLQEAKFNAFYSALAKAGISRLRIYASCSNLFTITSYKGYDPEVGSGVDYGNYPQARTYMMGLNLSF